PQIYWELGHPAADYEALVTWWADQVAETDVGLYIGEAAYKAVEGVFEEVSELGDHLDLTESLPAVDGNVFFSAKSLRTDTTGAVDDLLERHCAHPAIVAVLDQVPGEAPQAPRVLVARSTGDGVRVRWGGPGATGYALWHPPPAAAWSRRSEPATAPSPSYARAPTAAAGMRRRHTTARGAGADPRRPWHRGADRGRRPVAGDAQPAAGVTGGSADQGKTI